MCNPTRLFNGEWFEEFNRYTFRIDANAEGMRHKKNLFRITRDGRRKKFPYTLWLSVEEIKQR